MPERFAHSEPDSKQNVRYQRDDGGAAVRHAGNMSGDSKRFGQNLKRARKSAGLSQEKLATIAEVGSKGYISDLEVGNRPIPPGRTLQRLAQALGTSVAELVGATTPDRTMVRLVGYVGAGAAAHFYAGADDPHEMVDAPEDATEQTVAAEIRGTSLGPAFDRWLVYYDDVHSPVAESLHNTLCVVGLPNDQVLVKIIKPAGSPNRFHLISNGSEEALFDQEVVWAAKVTGMRPRR